MAAFVWNYIILNNIFVLCYGVQQQQQQQHERIPCYTPETLVYCTFTLILASILASCYLLRTNWS
jgi:hypothetical protein